MNSGPTDGVGRRALGWATVRVLVVGSGAREHAIVLALAQDPSVTALACAPGNAGTAAVAEQHGLDVRDPQAVAGGAKAWDADLVVIGPEVPLVAGVADAVRAAGIACFGPSAEAARIEGSKTFAKDVMAAAGVPTAAAVTVDNPAHLDAELAGFTPPYVVKDDGLAAGKGVVVTDDLDAARAHAMRLLDDGHPVLLESYLDGPEVSLFCLVDGPTVVPLLPAQDFKRVGDDDTGPNTGGMGAYSPVPDVDDELVDAVRRTVLEPTVAELARRGARYQGLLYAGLTLTAAGPKVLEFNCRFGDPETQAILPRITTDLADLAWAAAEGTLAGCKVSWDPRACVTVVLAAGGYPGSYRTGLEVEGLQAAAAEPGVHLFHAGTALDRAGRVRTAGGRVLGVTALGDDLADARARAYQAAELVRFDGVQYRHDIGAVLR